MYTLEIETKNHLRKIEKPRKARNIDLGVWSLVQVMDGYGKWHFVGHTMFFEDAQIATYLINEAIEKKTDSVYVDCIS